MAMSGSLLSLSDLLWLVALATVVVVVLAVRWRGSDGEGSVPGLPWVPLLGSLPWLGGGLPLHLLFTCLARRYGPLFSLYLGPHLTLVVSDHRHAREVLLQRGKEFAGRPRMVTTDLLTRTGKDIAFSDFSPLWKTQRRLVHTSFTLFGEQSNTLQDIVLEAVERMCQDLLSNGGRPVDPAPVVMREVTNVVCTLVFSSTYRHDDPELQQVMSYNDGIVQTITQGGLVDLFPWMQVFPNRTLSRLKECISVRDKLLTRKLEEHKALLGDGPPRDLLDALLQGQREVGGHRSPITDDHVVMTTAEAFGAGVETTSTTLLWILAYILHHPEVQERVQEELDEVVGVARGVCASDRARLPYLEAVINEGLRIRPVSPVLIPHTALVDTCVGGHRVDKGTRVLVNMWAIHHDPAVWRQPDLFCPERFLGDQGQRVPPPPSFLPFGAGPRVCVGESLARLELFLFLGSLLQRMSFTTPPGGHPPHLQGRVGVVLQPPAYQVAVWPREGWQATPTLHSNAYK